MRKNHSEEIISILEKIKSNSKFIGGGSGDAERREFRDVHTIWELGTTIKKILDDEKIQPDFRNDAKWEIVLKFDNKILGKNNNWSDYAYDWVLHFEEKNYFLKICKYAGYRENPEQNRFRKGDVRYLIPFFSKIQKSPISVEKMKKLENALSDDSILQKGAEEFREFLQKFRGQEKIPWTMMKSSLNDLRLKVENLTVNFDESLEERDQFREEMGEDLLSQISAALQLCLLDNESDFKYGYDLAKKQEFNKKPKSKNLEYLELLENLTNLLKDFKTKNRLILKTDYHDYEQLSSLLDAMKNDNDLKDFLNRKKNISDIFG
jgi:hypothetical protein